MIPDISVVVGVYVLFRLLEAGLPTGAGGVHGGLGHRRQSVLIFAAVVAALVVVAAVADVCATGALTAAGIGDTYKQGAP